MKAYRRMSWSPRLLAAVTVLTEKHGPVCERGRDPSSIARHGSMDYLSNPGEGLPSDLPDRRESLNGFFCDKHGARRQRPSQVIARWSLPFLC